MYHIKLLLSNNKKLCNTILFYFCGYNDCFLHTHMFNTNIDFDIMVIDIPGFGFNKYYNDFKYEPEKEFNYYDNIDILNNNLDKIFYHIDNLNLNYQKKILYGLSTGSNILINYIYYLERVKKLQKNEIKFNKLLLVSPFTKAVHKYVFVEIIMKLLLQIIILFTHKFDINRLINGTQSIISYDYKNKILNKIHHTNYIDYYYSFSPYVSRIKQPALIGWLLCVENSINKIINQTKINKISIIDCKCICANNYGLSEFDEVDIVLKPEYIEQDIKNIFEINVQRFDCIHDCLLKYNDNNNNYEIMLNYLFE